MNVNKKLRIFLLSSQDSSKNWWQVSEFQNNFFFKLVVTAASMRSFDSSIVLGLPVSQPAAAQV